MTAIYGGRAMSDLLPYALACAGTYEASAVPQWRATPDTGNVYLSLLGGVHCIAAEGTHNFDEWVLDFMAEEVEVTDHPRFGPVHKGIWSDVEKCVLPVAGYLQSLGWPVYDVTGHSKGAGWGLLFHAAMKDLGHPPRRTAAFESPRIGTPVLRQFLNAEAIYQTATQNAHGKDIVTQVPWFDGYCDVREPLVLTVPDDLDVAAKHRIPAVIAALEAMP